MRVFSGGELTAVQEAAAGQVVVLRGIEAARIGDTFGRLGRAATRRPQFARPSLATVVEPQDESDRGRLHTALTQLAEQDPLIDLRQDDVRRELQLSLYGEVQKEVIGALLVEEYGVPVTFRESTVICVERVLGTGRAVEMVNTDSNPFLATVGLRVEPAEVGAGVSFDLEVELGSMPPAFFTAVETAAPFDPGARAVRVGDPRLPGGDDALRLPGTAEPLPRDVRQVDVEHRRATSGT